MATKKNTAKKNEVASRSNRVEEPHGIARVGGDGPDWLAEIPEDEMETGLEGMSEYRVLARVKTIQSMTARDLKQTFGEGALVAVPGPTLLAGEDEALQVVPVFAFTEFCLWSDLKDSSSPVIQQRSFDKAGDLAAASRDPERRFESYGEPDSKTGEPKFVRRYVEHLCFACIIYDEEHPMHGQPVVLSFQRGEFSTGKNFISAMMMRRAGGRPIPMWGQVWQISTIYREKGDDKKWYGLQFAPGEPSEITADQVEFFRDQYQSLKEDYIRNRLLVDRAESSDEAPGSDDPDVDL